MNKHDSHLYEFLCTASKHFGDEQVCQALDEIYSVFVSSRNNEDFIAYLESAGSCGSWVRPTQRQSR